jgi:hypothetical protein
VGSHDALMPSLRGAQRRGNLCAFAKAAVDCFVPRNDGAGGAMTVWGRNDALMPSLRGAQRRGNLCAFAKAAVDCFVPRNDGAGAQRRPNPVIARRAAPWQSMCLAKAAMDCFVPRNDGAGGAMTGRGAQ